MHPGVGLIFNKQTNYLRRIVITAWRHPPSITYWAKNFRAANSPKRSAKHKVPRLARTTEAGRHESVRRRPTNLDFYRNGCAAIKRPGLLVASLQIKEGQLIESRRKDIEWIDWETGIEQQIEVKLRQRALIKQTIYK